MAVKTEKTIKRKAAFLSALAEGETITAAIAIAAWSKSEAYKFKANDQTFAREWAIAEDAGTDLLLAEARRRAVKGVDKTIFYKGTPIGIETNYSDTLLIFLLKQRRPFDFDDSMRRAKIEREWSKEDGKDSGPTLVSLDAVLALLTGFEARKALTADHGNTAR